MSEPKTLHTRNLNKIYSGRAVVNDVSIEVKATEIVGLLGPNGAGKTTTFYMVVGLTSPDAGEVFLGDRDITELPMYLRAQRGSSYLPQEPSVFRKLSVEDNLRAIFETLDVPHDEQERRIESLLKRFGLIRVRKTEGYALSGGEPRRVEIARALVHPPGRAVRRYRPDCRAGYPAHHPALEGRRNRRSDHRSQRPGNFENHRSRLYHQQW